MTSAGLFDDELTARAEALVRLYHGLGLRIATAESCTGGLLAGLLTEIPGSSAVVERGYVVYSNAAKQDCLGVPASVIAAHGAVSRETALAMADGALAASAADIAISLTGIAGPGGGAPDKPVGLIWFGCAARGGASAAIERRFGAIGRALVRRAALLQALDILTARTR